MDKLKTVIVASLLIGVVLILATQTFPAIDFSFILTAYAVFGFLLFSTFALKLFTKAETFWLFSMVRTEKFIGFIERISRFRLWDLLADLGLVIGFGAIAVDYLWARNLSRPKRILLDAFALLLLFSIFFVPISFFLRGPENLLLLTIFSLSFALGGLMLLAIAVLAFQAVDIFAKFGAGKKPCPGVAPVIPGLQIPNVPIAPPMYVWLVFLVILVVHEFSHGALIKRANARLKSVGLLLAGLLPIGAFVEPDEAEIKLKSERQQLRIFAIGPMANLYSIPIFIIVSNLLLLAMAPALGPYVEGIQTNAKIESVVVATVLDDYDICGDTFKSPAMGQVEEGWLIKEYNGVKLESFHSLSQAISSNDRNVSLVLETETGEIVERTLEKNVHNTIGLSTEWNFVKGTEPPLMYNLLSALLSAYSGFLTWLILLSFAIALVNFLPIAIFDGARIARIMLVPYFGFLKMNKQETEKFIGRFFLWIVAGLLILNAWPLVL